ncbi:MAG: translation initiation factor IF-1 [Armatimonadetes bacterium]|nr:translation initiation factor IF-1 [Akkermansiaceae bacterium]
MPEAAIRTIGEIIERKGEILYRVELMNGKVVLGHLSKPLTEANIVFDPGTKVIVELTPYDFDQARILDLAEG